ncbi:MAG: tryptophan synthase subunit beta, partial [Chitinispirillaceae bacterium]|nr:tryptophan synthase subunit beta [Chitinispirillaceae bacterium]
AGGLGLSGTKHAARLTPTRSSRPGILHGSYSYVLQDRHGQIANTHSISAGLDYSGVGPEHAFLRGLRRVRYTYATDKEAVAAFTMLSECEGIIPALESAHAVAYAIEKAPEMDKRKIMVVNLSGRGDKDIFSVAEYLGKSI